MACKSTPKEKDILDDDFQSKNELDSLIVTEELRQQPIENGTYKFTLMFAEFMSRDSDTSCDVLIDGLNITIQQNGATNLPGDKILLKGRLMKHNSGKWIVSDNEQDKFAAEIGGCTDITVIDFKNKIVVWC